MFKPKEHHVRQSQVEKFTRYSIRKVSFGAASVAVATGLFFLGGGSVQAAEQLTNSEPTEVQNSQNLTDKSSEPSKEVTGQESATDKTSDGQKTTSVKESATDTQASAVETPNVVTEKVAINTTSLEDLVAKVESRLSQLTEGKKTKSVIDDAKNLVNKAKELLKDDTKTQAKVDAHAKQLSSSLIILNSIKSEATDEEKVNKNQDPRNGKAISGNGESGFRADTYKVGDNNELIVPTENYTGKSVYKFDENATSASGNAGDVRVTGGNPKDLELEIRSRLHEGSDENPAALATSGGKSSLNKGRQDYPLSAEMVSKLENEARLWKGKLKPDGNSILRAESNVYGDRGGYEFLATEIYKLGYEQGVDRVYIPEVKSRFAITEASKAKGWEIVSAKPWNLLKGLTYDEKTDSIQGRVIEQFQNGVRDLRFNVVARNTITNQTVNIAVQNLRTGWVSWQDTKAPKLEVSNDAYIGTVGENLDVDIVYKDHSGSSFNGGAVGVNYKLADGRTVRITGLGSKQAVSGMAGYITTKNDGVLGEDKTSIPGVNYDLTKNGYPVETDSEGQVNYSKGKLSGVPTRAGIYTVGVYAKDYDHKDTWSPSGHEVQKYITVVVKPTVSVKNIHAYETSIPVTISQGATTAEITLPDGKVTKLEVKGDKWVVADGTTNEKAVKGTELGQVGSEINIPVSSETTKNAATDTIKAKATTESVRASLLRNELSLTDNNGSHKATLNSTTGHWELEDSYKEERKELSNGEYELTQRQVYTETQTNGTVNYYIYSYTRTFNNQGIVTNVGEVRRDKTEVPRVNTSSSQGGMVTVEYNPVTQTWTSSDNSRVTATKKGNFWNIRTESGFTGLVKASIAESDDKASILNNAPTASSTSYTTVKGATVDLVKQASAAVTIRDTEDDATTSPKKETTITKVTVTAPSGQQTEYTDIEQAKAHLLSEVGIYKVKVEVKDSNGNVVTANTDTETGTDKGAETAVNSTTYTITVKDQETKKLYKVEDDTVTNDELKGKVEPTTIDGFTPTKNDFTNIPTTAGKAGQTIPTPASVTYTKGTETIPVETKVDVVVLAKVEPTGVTVLKDSTGLDEAVKAKAVEAAKAVPTDKLPDGVTVSVKEVKQGTVPATSTNGVQTPATVVVEYKDVNNNVVATKEVTVPVTVVSSTPSKIVVFEGEKPTANQAKAAVTPGTDGTKGEPTTLPETAGKAGATDVKVDVPVTYDNGKLTETVSVPVTVLPKASGEVEVPKGESVDKVKEVAKAKAAALVEAADFKGKLPTGATVTVGDITEEVLATITAEKGTNRGIVNVPATYTVDGTTYNTTVPVTINVLGSETKPVYTVEGTKPDAEKVKNAVTPGNGGTANAPTETGLPETTGKAGATDVTATTTVTYPNGTETVTVPVTVLPKATPEKVTTLKDTTGDNLTTAVKEKAQAALGKLTLPTGVTVELVPNQTYTVPATTSNGDKDTVPVKVQYKDATGTVVAEDTINVPVTVVSSTPSKIVVFEGDEVTADQAKEAVTPGADGTKGNPVIPEDLTKTTGNKDVTVPVTYEGIKDSEQVKVPVTVLPKASGEVEVAKGSTVDKVKEVAKAKAQTLIEVADFKGKLPTGATVTVGDITEEVLATITAEKGTNKGIVNVPATYTVDGKTYNTTIPVTINVLGSERKTVYTLEGTQPEPVDVNEAITPDKGGDLTPVTEADINKDVPTDKVKVGATDLSVKATVKYPTGDETVDVPVKVLPKAAPTDVTVLKDTDENTLTDAVKAKATEAVSKLTNLPDGITASLDERETSYTLPKTDSNGDKKTVPVKVLYKDDKGNVVGEDTINVPVKVVSSTPSKIVVFEGEKPTADQAKEAVTQGADGTKGEPTTLPETAGKAGATDVKVDVPVTYDNGKLTETVSVPVTVLPKPEAEGILVAKNSDKEKAKEKVLAKAKKAIEDATFKGKLPADATVEIDNTVPVTIPELTDDTEVEVTVKYTVPGQDTPLTTKVKVPVTIVEGVPQIVPIKENNDVLPNPEKSIDKTDYPEGATFRYKTPEGQTTPIDVTTPGDKDVTVEVLDKNGNPIAEVPATVRVVESYPKYVPVDPAKKQPDPKENINPNDFPTGTTFEYKDNTPVDTTTPGEKPVTVVAKLNGQPIVEIPATIVVVEPKTQYVPVNAENDKKPKPQNSITPDDYPEGSTFEYKTPEGQTTPYDGTTPGEKDVTVVVKDSDGDTIVEVPAKIKVVQGKEQLIPVNAEDKDKPKAEDSITPSDYPEGSTFEYKVPEGQTTPYDGTTPGDKPVTVVVKDKNGNVLVEVPATIKVVESKPTPIETPVTTTPLTQEDYTKGITIPKGGKVTNVENIPDLTTPSEKTPVKVTITLPNDKSYTVDVPVTVTPVKEIETPVTTTPLTPEDYTKGITIPKGGKVTNVENIPDLTTPGKKDPVKVTVTLPNGKVVTVDVPVNVTPIKEIETPVTTTPLTPEDYTKGITIPKGGKVTKVENIPDLTTPGKKDPVKVTITLPNGKVVTVDVPVNVTPIKEIETPVTTTPLTPEDYTKGIIIPKGGKVTKVENIPDLTTPGKKDPVKVTITLPNGKVVTVEVPVNVTPIEDIVKKQGDPITAEDVEKHIPKGAKVISIGDKPTTDVPGERPSIPVVIELPNGIRVTMDIPVIVTPKVTPVVVSVGTPVTPEDVEKHIELPKGWKVTKVGEIPTTETPGAKPVVKVEIELPDGRKITVDVPVIVTPTVRQIVVPQGTPITPDDVKGHIDLPKEPGWEIVEVGEIPTTIPAGVKPSVKVKIKVPTGEIIEVDVPVIVTPKVTPIVVEVGTPITEEEVKKKVDLPEGWEIVEVGEIPTTETPGAKPVVKVKVKLPDGRIITVDVPVTVTPKSQNGGGAIAQNGDSTQVIVTEYLDENGNRITSDKEGKHNPIELEGYEFSHSTTDAKGNTLHHYKKVTPKAPQAVEEVPTTKQEQPSTPEVKSTPVAKQELPNTGTTELEVFTPAVLAILAGLGLATPTVAKKKDEE